MAASILKNTARPVGRSWTTTQNRTVIWKLGITAAYLATLVYLNIDYRWLQEQCRGLSKCVSRPSTYAGLWQICRIEARVDQTCQNTGPLSTQSGNQSRWLLWTRLLSIASTLIAFFALVIQAMFLNTLACCQTPSVWYSKRRGTVLVSDFCILLSAVLMIVCATWWAILIMQSPGTTGIQMTLDVDHHICSNRDIPCVFGPNIIIAWVVSSVAVMMSIVFMMCTYREYVQEFCEKTIVRGNSGRATYYTTHVPVVKPGNRENSFDAAYDNQGFGTLNNKSIPMPKSRRQNDTDGPPGHQRPCSYPYCEECMEKVYL